MLLSRLVSAYDNELMPNALCPWRYSEYIHKCGYAPLDLITQRHLQYCYLKLCTTSEQYRKSYLSCDNYLRKEHSDYNKRLLTPAWSAVPCVTFVEGQFPLITTCYKHTYCCNTDYFHVPRQPHTILASEKDNQLCHTVIKTHTLKSMKATTYSNAFQMHEHRGLFQKLIYAI